LILDLLQSKADFEFPSVGLIVTLALCQLLALSDETTRTPVPRRMGTGGP
jgi:hypothetical protein